MRKHATPGNMVFLIVLGVFTSLQYPSIRNNFKNEGRSVTPSSYHDYKSGRSVIFPVERSVVIFWATWCGPCKIEMDRLRNAVHSSDLPGDKIFAINPFEPDQEIIEFLRNHNFPFIFINNRKLAQDLQVDKTPTTLFIDNGRVVSMSSGLSLIGIWRAVFFLKGGLW